MKYSDFKLGRVRCLQESNNLTINQKKDKMKKLLFLMLLLIPLVSFGQDCKYEVNRIDDFTNVRVVQTYSAALVSVKEARKTQSSVIFCCLRYDDDCYVQIGLLTRKPVFILEDQKVYFKLSNDSIVTVISPKTNMDTELNQYNFYNINHRYYIEKDELLQFKEVGVKKIRVETSEGYLDFNVSKDGQNHMKEFITCLFNSFDEEVEVPKKGDPLEGF